MPKYNALDLEVRLKACDFDESVSRDITFVVGSQIQQRLADTATAFSRAFQLFESHLPCLNYNGPLHFLGSDANLPFYLVDAGPLKRPHGLGSATNAPTLPTKKALFVTVSFPLAAVRRSLLQHHTPLTSVRVEIFLNGTRVAVSVIPSRSLSDSRVEALTFSGRRIDNLHEKAWLLSTDPEGGQNSHNSDNLDAACQTDATRQRWRAISDNLRADVKERLADPLCRNQPTTDYLATLADLEMPESMSKYKCAQEPAWGTLDVLVSVGDSMRKPSNFSYTASPALQGDLPHKQRKVYLRDGPVKIDDGGAATTAMIERRRNGTSCIAPTLGPSRLSENESHFQEQAPESHATPTPKGSRHLLILKLRPTRPTGSSQGSAANVPSPVKSQDRKTRSTSIRSVVSVDGVLINTDAPWPEFVTDEIFSASGASNTASVPRADLKRKSSAGPVALVKSRNARSRQSAPSPLKQVVSINDDVGEPKTPRPKAHQASSSQALSDAHRPKTRASSTYDSTDSVAVNVTPCANADTSLASSSSPPTVHDSTNKSKLEPAQPVSSKQQSKFTQSTKPEHLAKPNQAAHGGAESSSTTSSVTTRQQASSRLSQVEAPPSPNTALLGRLAFSPPELSRNCVLGYMEDGERPGDIRGVRHIMRERHGWFHEDTFVCGMRFVLGPDAGSNA